MAGDVARSSARRARTCFSSWQEEEDNGAPGGLASSGLGERRLVLPSLIFVLFSFQFIISVIMCLCKNTKGENPSISMGSEYIISKLHNKFQHF